MTRLRSTRPGKRAFYALIAPEIWHAEPAARYARKARRGKSRRFSITPTGASGAAFATSAS
jgi:hypothetical protein